MGVAGREGASYASTPLPHRFMEKNSELKKKGNIQILIRKIKSIVACRLVATQ
jgi:hypothetical protein